jgi:hypothetical protein
MEGATPKLLHEPHTFLLTGRVIMHVFFFVLCSDASVLSEASPGLAAVREERRANKDKARALATQIARDLFAQVAA